jgi:putative membrane protein insertion efficiency factor
MSPGLRALLCALPQRLLIGAVRAYRLLLSPWLGNACRFEPTCSVYAIGALERHGAFAGTALAVGRIGRCHPWCAGGLDPVPAEPPRLFRALLATPSSPTPPPASGASDTASS